MVKTTVYHQILEAVRWFARNSGYNVTDVLSEIENDIMHGTYEKTPLRPDLEFWYK